MLKKIRLLHKRLKALYEKSTGKSKRRKMKKNENKSIKKNAIKMPRKNNAKNKLKKTKSKNNEKKSIAKKKAKIKSNPKNVKGVKIKKLIKKIKGGAIMASTKKAMKTTAISKPKLAMKEVPEWQRFWNHDGKIFKNYKELCTGLRSMSENAYRYHANEQKNDYAKWIKEVFGDEKLSNELRNAKSKNDAASCIANCC